MRTLVAVVSMILAYSFPLYGLSAEKDDQQNLLSATEHAAPTSTEEDACSTLTEDAALLQNVYNHADREYKEARRSSQQLVEVVRSAGEDVQDIIAEAGIIAAAREKYTDAYRTLNNVFQDLMESVRQGKDNCRNETSDAPFLEGQ